MSAAYNEEPAFPWSGDGPNYRTHKGLTMRDWFAGQAIAGIAEKPGDGCTGYLEQRARVAYAMADAMLAARERKSP